MSYISAVAPFVERTHTLRQLFSTGGMSAGQQRCGKNVPGSSLQQM